MAAESTASSAQAYDIRPVPDPTVLTTQATDRLEAMLRNLIMVEIRHRSELTDAEFRSIRMQFVSLELRTAEQKGDTKAALDAALAAQKEAVKEQTLSSEKSITKSETATVERIKTIETLLASATSAIDDKISDLKDRVRAMEARGNGVSEGTKVVHDASAAMMSRVAIVISGLFVLISLAGLIYTAVKP